MKGKHFLMNALISEPIAALAHHSRSELIETCLAAAAQSQAIYTRLYADGARACARHADAMRAANISPPSSLAGLPISIKDLLDVAGEATTAGSIVLKDAPPATKDAPVVRRLRAAGAAIIGKTNMTEFAFSGLGLNPHYGTAANPADQKIVRIPGGSSSGAAVSVAAGHCVAAIGSDTGGSIRIPAALCGLVGFKSTARRVPTQGVIPLSTTLDTICALARSVDDCIAVDSVIADISLQVPHLPLKGLRLAVPQTLMLETLDTHVASTFAATLTRLSAAGASIIDAPFLPLADFVHLNKFSGAEAFAWHRKLLATSETQYDPRVSARIKLGSSLSAAEYIDLQAARRAWIAQMEDLLAPYDALIMPTTPIVAPRLADLEASDELYFAANYLVLRNPSSINFLDGCAVSLPCHTPGTLPVGLMVAGAAMQDAKILAVARAIESALIA
jgi:Asp-tRNA(Asn)/Glu-tRNA(Gln) amidotransferase A subunit family amidase